MTKLQELENERQALINESESVMDGTTQEIVAHQDKIARVNALIDLEKLRVSATPVDEPDGPAPKASAILVDMIRGKRSRTDIAVQDLLSEGTDASGGYTVPEDIQTRIIEYQRKRFDIRQYVHIETVGTSEGQRTILTNKPQASGFASLAEGASIAAQHEPTFGRLSYKIQKYAGYIPVTNELTSDSTENITAFLAVWLGREEVNTYNYQVFQGSGSSAAEGILGQITSTGKLKNQYVTKATAPTLKEFKTILNTKLNDIVSSQIRIFTTPTGYNYLDGLQDTDGHPLLQKDITMKSGYAFLGYEVVNVPEDFLAQVTLDTVAYTPFIIGDLDQAYTIFDRKKMSIDTTNIGGDAWRKDETELRGIFRFDGKLNDCEAIYTLLAKTSVL